MPIEYHWLIPSRVIGARWWDTVTVAQMLAYDQALMRDLDTARSHPVHILSDELALRQEPSVRDYIQTQSPRHPCFGWYIILQPRSRIIARLVAQMACSVLNLRFRIVDDEASAWAFFAARRSIDSAAAARIAVSGRPPIDKSWF